MVLYPVQALGRHTIVFFGFDFAMGTLAEDILKKTLHYDPWYYVFGLKLLLLIFIFFAWYIVRGVANKGRND